MQTTRSRDAAEPKLSGAVALRELFRDGRLADEFPRVPGLLAELDEAGLAQAGQVLSQLAPDAVLAAHPGTPVVSTAITGHGTVAPLRGPLAAEMGRHGLLMKPYVAPFDSYVFDLSDPASELSRSAPDIVVCLLDPMVVFDEVASPWRVPDVQRVLDEKLALFGWLADRFAARGHGQLVFNTLPLPRRFAAQLIDHRSRARLGAAWRTANASLLELGERHAGLTVLDLDPILAEGVPAEDVRLSVYAKQHLSSQLMARCAREIGHLARFTVGRTKKVLAVDLDNTIWGGVLGEDGPERIEVSGSYRGEAFRAMQKAVKQLGSQGVVVVAVSKNDQEPVRKVLAEHPDMTLRESDFVRVVANWAPKSGNLRETAELLNLGVESFVFVDDSPYECGLVRHDLPQVAVVPVGEDAAEHVQRLLRDGWFDVRELTDEDTTRPEKYRAESDRGDFLKSFDSIEDYLRELGVEVVLRPAQERDFARVSQLTLRTNQFNLTTVRIPAAELGAVLARPGSSVLTIRSRDRFGDNGMVGVVFVRREGDSAYLDNMLLSCRVFARGIEQACLSAILTALRDGGATAVFGEYRATAKNEGVRELYPRYGFAVDGENDEEGMAHHARYRHELTDIVPVPGHVRLIADLEELKK